MKKKKVYISMCLVVLIASYIRYFVVLDHYKWYEILLPITIFLVFSLCLVFSEKTILFVHWYLKNSSIEEFNPGFVLFNKILFSFGILLGALMPLYCSGPIVL